MKWKSYRTGLVLILILLSHDERMWSDLHSPCFPGGLDAPSSRVTNIDAVKLDRVTSLLTMTLIIIKPINFFFLKMNILKS